jgi:hypothetical protein
MAVLGAEPGTRATWDEGKRRSFAGGTTFRDINDLVNYFNCHRKASMSHKFSDDERMILGRNISKWLKQGYTRQGIRHLIDGFYEQEVKADVPVYVFVSNDMQTRLRDLLGVYPEDVGDVLHSY